MYIINVNKNILTLYNSSAYRGHYYEHSFLKGCINYGKDGKDHIQPG